MYLMRILDRCRGACLTFAVLAGTTVGWAQGVNPLGGEFNLIGLRPGDQVLPAVALSQHTGVVAFFNQGLGIFAADLNNNYTSQSIFKVHKAANATNDQVRPGVVLLARGQTLFVWQSKVAHTNSSMIYARFANGSNFTSTADVLVNSSLVDQKVDPVVSALPDGGAVVAWSSFGQDGSGWGVYARKLTAAGAVVTTPEFLVNQNVVGNQYHPAICTLADGNVVIAWISEGERAVLSRDIYARVFTPNGVPLTREFMLNSSANPCSTPALAPLASGGFTAAWTQKDTVLTNSLDVWGRAFAVNGTPTGAAFRINGYLYGDQYQPKLASCPSGVLAVWTSLGEDGDREGVDGRFLAGGAAVSGDEFLVNTTTASQQLEPYVAWNGVDRFLVVWTSFAGVTPGGQLCGFDLFGQMYSLKP